MPAKGSKLKQKRAGDNDLDVRISSRIQPAHAKLLERACQIEGLNRSEFVRKVVVAALDKYK